MHLTSSRLAPLTTFLAIAYGLIVASLIAPSTVAQTVASTEPQAEVKQANAKDDDTATKKKTTVALIIDYGDGAEKRLTAIPWKSEMTVKDAMEFAKRHPHGITFEYRGKGETAFLTKIDDAINQAANGQNWIFYIDEERGDSSFGIAKVPAGGAILWRFE